MKRWSPLLTIVLVLALAGLSMACPLCKDSVGNSDAPYQAGVPSGFNNSIYVMLGALFVVMGLVATVIVKGIRSTNVARASRP